MRVSASTVSRMSLAARPVSWQRMSSKTHTTHIIVGNASLRHASLDVTICVILRHFTTCRISSRCQLLQLSIYAVDRPVLYVLRKKARKFMYSFLYLRRLLANVQNRFKTGEKVLVTKYSLCILVLLYAQKIMRLEYKNNTHVLYF